MKVVAIAKEASLQLESGKVVGIFKKDVFNGGFEK